MVTLEHSLTMAMESHLPKVYDEESQLPEVYEEESPKLYVHEERLILRQKQTADSDEEAEELSLCELNIHL